MRYYRQKIMKEIGEEGQRKIREAKVLIIGAGGLGSPVLTYLACAGVGELHVADFDRVSISNLNRQFIHDTNNIGQLKTESAKEFVNRLNPDVCFFEYTSQITSSNIEELVKDKQVVIDCVDNIETRLLVNQACVTEGIPLIEGAVDGFFGFVFVIGKKSPCLECLGYEKTVLKTPVPILGTTTGVIGSLQANECIKILIDAENSSYGKLISYDGVDASIDTIVVEISTSCSIHKDLNARNT